MPGTREGQTKLLAILFVDQVGSTALLQELGDLEADQMRHVLEPILDASVVDHEGRVVKHTGDGLMAVFESASQALDAGVAMHKRALRANRSLQSSARIELRVGVSVGDVTVEVDDCHGTPVVEAARLEAAAPDGMMLCSDLTRMLAGNRSEAIFDRQELVDAKGFTDPLSAWVVTWEHEPERPDYEIPESLGSGGRFPFVGRTPELKRARAVWENAIDQQASGLLVAGEPGVGKTRLARELAAHVTSENGMVLYGRCDEGMGVPFQPFAQALNSFIEGRADDLDQTMLGRFPGDLRRLSPDLGHLMPDLPVAIEADSDTEQYRLFDAVLSWLEAIADEAPVLLVIDDFQWGAEPTLHLLRHVLRRGSSARVCVLGTYRDTEADTSDALTRFLGDMHRVDSVTTVSLHGLDGEGISELLTSADLGLPGDETAVADLVARIEEQTAGNPFFITEIVTMIREQGVRSLDAGHTSALSEVILDRVSRLAPLTIEILETTAVAGWAVSLDVLMVASGKPRGDLVDAVEQALQAGLLIEAPDPPIRYRFQHDLVRSTLYNGMSLGRRTQRHHDIALAIERVHERNLTGWLDDLAFHYLRSDDPSDVDRAVETSQLAGDEAADGLGFATAAGHYENALELLERFGCTHPPALRGRLLLCLAVAKKKAGQRGTRALFFEATEVAEANDDRGTIVQAALANTRGFFSSAGRTDEGRVRMLETALDAIGPDDSSHRAKLLANLSVELTFGRQHDRREQLSDESLAIAERVDDPTTMAHILNQRIGFFWNAQGLPQRLVLCQRLREVADELGLAQWKFTAASSQFQAAMEAGDLPLADRCIDEMLSLTDELRQPVVESYLKLRQSVRHIVNGDLEEGERLAVECFELGQSAGQPDALTFYFAQLINLRFHQGRMHELEEIVAKEAANNPGLPSLQAALAVLYCEIGNLDAARPVLGDLVDRSGELLHDLSWLVTTGLMADACFQLGDRDRAVILHEHLKPYRDQCIDNATNWFGSVSRCLGLLEHTMGWYDEADRSFEAAVDWHARMPAPALLARTRVEWATSLTERPSPETARAHLLLERCLPEAERMGLATVVRRAQALLS